MPRSSQEAIDRRNAKRRAKRAAARKPVVFKIAVRKGSPEYRRTLPKFRRGIGFELKASYFKQAVRHCAEVKKKERGLLDFDTLRGDVDDELEAAE